MRLLPAVMHYIMEFQQLKYNLRRTVGLTVASNAIMGAGKYVTKLSKVNSHLSEYCGCIARLSNSSGDKKKKCRTESFQSST
jgi:hypothetical protein